MQARHFQKVSWIALPAAAILFCTGMPTGAQTTAPAQNASNTGTIQDRNQDRDNDVRYQELATFDRYLDSHPEIAQQLRKDPTLVNDKEYMNDRASLRDFLEDHPAIRSELKQDPNAFMRDEARYEQHDDWRDDHHDSDRDDDHGNATRREEVTRFDQFLDSHPEISAQLHKDPSLADNEAFVKNHPALQTYLQEHPEIREALQKNPNIFMGEEARYDRTESRGDDRGFDRDDHDADRTRFDQFLDTHRETAEALRKNPSLVNNEEFLKTHPELQAYLQEHPEIRADLKENPTAFAQQEPVNEHRERGVYRDPEAGRYASFGEFLGGHASISDQLSKDPTLVKNEEFLQNHPELREYLNAHPDVQQELLKNPDSFVKSAQQFNKTNGGQTVKSPTPNPKQ